MSAEDSNECKCTKHPCTSPKRTSKLGKKLTFGEASRCLNTLGKDETGVRYAYLMITATDRQLTDVSIILNFKHVLFLDLSFNDLDLDAIQVLAKMPFLIYLKATHNKVDSAAVNDMPYLQVLNLNKNYITQTDDICQTMLETLELQHNQIFNAQFVSDSLSNLKFLDICGNHLMDLSGSYPPTLEKLYLSDNTIISVNESTISTLKNLTHLFLRDNNIRRLNGFTAELENLNYLNLRNNRIVKLREFRKLACLPKLETLVITGNPVMYEIDEIDIPIIKCEDADDFYPATKDPVRVCILVLLPRLKRINKDIVTMEELDQSVLTSKRKYEEIMDQLSDADEDLAMYGTETQISSESEFKSYIYQQREGGEEYKSEGGEENFEAGGDTNN